MAGKAKKKLQPCDIQGCKYFKLIPKLFESLHDIGTQRDTASNRKFFFDQYIALQLLYFFSPVVTSLNGLRESTDLKKFKNYSAPNAFQWERLASRRPFLMRNRCVILFKT